MAKKTHPAHPAVRIVYAALLFLFGVLLWTFWQEKQQDYRELSSSLDSSVGSVLEKNGIGRNETTAAREEKKSGSRLWVKHSREIRLPAGTDAEKLAAEIRKTAGKLHLKTVSNEPATATRRSLEIRLKDMVLSHVVFISTVTAQPAVAARPVPPPPAPAPVIRKKKRFALVIDDVGSRTVEPYLELGIPITFAIMPFESRGKAIAAGLAKRERPFILHLPMEPESYPKNDPGSAGLFLKMTQTELRAQFEKDLAAVPGACGVSNHMGSAFSADEDKMAFLLGMVKEKGLFYFDSGTTPKTTAAKVARRLDMPCAVNGIFVDLQDDPVFMRKQYEYILKRFRKQDTYIAIGHIQKKNMIPVLKEYIPRFRDAGIEFVYLPELAHKARPAAALASTGNKR